ncbi:MULTISPECIES: hypothetical protein [Pseudoalteromonas]|uniref:Uncharacterized protein n=1 Tax=Pseudoalteromonas maricaloris TaxID=184924 RepID=A0ABZ0M8S3_9GAMM|nr:MULTISPECIES: hypothetical protein [Pseudoalteromonas]MBE0374028.1 hypothetical protein [Pseudoalteromonas flavipulchra NCIMB 2033 = ATCC BAA-314]WOX27920.1 hypothetical protein R5H13_14870 [Pseudoalteromonas maricaloris]
MLRDFLVLTGKFVAFGEKLERTVNITPEKHNFSAGEPSPTKLFVL